MTMRQFTHEADGRSVSRNWSGAIIALGLVLTAAWVCCLGYGIVKLIEIAI